MSMSLITIAWVRDTQLKGHAHELRSYAKCTSLEENMASLDFAGASHEF